MATFDLNIELAQRGDDAALRAMRLKEFKYEYNVVIWESQIDPNSLHPALGNRNPASAVPAAVQLRSGWRVLSTQDGSRVFSRTGASGAVGRPVGGARKICVAGVGRGVAGKAAEHHCSVRCPSTGLPAKARLLARYTVSCT
jgi:hypothetical protein